MPWLLVWCVLFAVAYTQSPLFFSNQHQYFVHGYALADVGYLRDDWQANTQDPTPFFSRLIASTHRQFGPWMFQAYYFVLLGCYLATMRRLMALLPCSVTHGVGEWVFLGLFTASHAAFFRWASVQLTGFDYPWFLQAGVAGQYALGTGLQPSAFAVLLLASFVAFLRGRAFLAGLAVGLACLVHSTYLLPGGLLVATYVVYFVWNRQWRHGLLCGLTALGCVAPVLVYIAEHFTPTPDDYDRFLESRRVLAEVRIPHHCLIPQWFDVIAALQCVAMGIGIWWTRGTRLFPVLAFVAVVSLVLSIVAYLVDGHSLMLMFPWRLSVLLMPMSVAIFCAWVGRLVNHCAARPTGRKACWLVVIFLLLTTVGGGVFIKVQGIGYRMNETELPLLEYVKEHKQKGDVYLIPVRFPKLSAARKGSISTTFTPPPRSQPGATLIPVDLQRFRLHAQAPIYVDFKSVPYGETEVLEWQQRIRNAERWYDQRDWDNPELWREVRLMGITHVVTTADRDIQCQMFERVFHDENYRLYRFKSQSDAP